MKWALALAALVAPMALTSVASAQSPPSGGALPAVRIASSDGVQYDFVGCDGTTPRFTRVSDGSVVLARTGETATPLDVHISTSSIGPNPSSTDGNRSVPPVVTIPAGAASVAVDIPEPLVVTIEPDASYTVGDPSSVTVNGTEPVVACGVDPDRATGGLAHTGAATSPLLILGALLLGSGIAFRRLGSSRVT